MNSGLGARMVFVMPVMTRPSRCNFVMGLAATVFVLLAAAAAHAQTPVSLNTSPSIRLTVQNPQQLQPVSYTLQIFADGSGIYRASLSADSGPGQIVQRPIHIGEPLLSQLFGTVGSHRFFSSSCSAAGGRIAFTGTKTLAYTGPDGAESCTFNYSHEKQVNEVASELMAVAYTLQEGLRLTRDHRYDRMGLYDELGSLQDAAQSHMALEIQNIAPELRSIAQDDAVMNIARRRAQALLIASASLR